MFAFTVILGFNDGQYDVVYHAYKPSGTFNVYDAFVPDNRNQPILCNIDKKHKVKFLKFINKKLSEYVEEKYPDGFMMPNLQDNFINIREYAYSMFEEYISEFKIENAELFI